MASIVPYLLGKHLTAVTMTPQTVAANGSLTSGTAQTITALVRSFSVDPTIETEDIRGVNATQANAVPHTYDSELEFEVLLRSDANASLVSLLGSVDYWLVAVTAGANTYTFYGVRISIPTGLQNRGGNTYRVRFRQFDPATATPLVVT